MIVLHAPALHKRTLDPLGTWGLLDPQLPAAERIRRLRRLRGTLRTLYGVQADQAADAIHAAILQPDNPALIRDALDAIKAAGRQSRRPALPWHPRPATCEARP